MVLTFRNQLNFFLKKLNLIRHVILVNILQITFPVPDNTLDQGYFIIKSTLF